MKVKSDRRTMLFLNLFILIAKSLQINSFSSSEISSLESDSFKNGIVATDIGKLSFINGYYIIPLRLFKAQITGQYEELHAQFMALYNLIDQRVQTNFTDSLVNILLTELNQFKHDYFNSLNTAGNLFKWQVIEDRPIRQKKSGP